MSGDKNKREQRIAYWLKEIGKYGEYAVNIKHRIQLGEDKDLQFMLEQGMIKRKRINNGGKKSITVLTLRSYDEKRRRI